MVERARTFQSPYRYELHVEIPATDAAVLVDALEGEPFGLGKRLGADELNRQIRELELSVRTTSSQRWDDFEKDIEILSIYLPQFIEGREIHVDAGAVPPKVEGWKIVGHRGETERLRLDVSWDEESGAVVGGGDDIADIERRWSTLPSWMQSALRTKHAVLGKKQ
jgi:hypothetical protein